jgi:hypothetical protein
MKSFDVKTKIEWTWNVWCVTSIPQPFSLCPEGTTVNSSAHNLKKVSLVYFNMFEHIKLTSDSVMQQAGVSMLYIMTQHCQQAICGCPNSEHNGFRMFQCFRVISCNSYIWKPGKV